MQTLLLGSPKSLENFAQLLGYILIFIIVVVLCFYTTKFVAGQRLTKKTIGNFEVIETFPLAQNKYLQLVRTGKKYIVISVSKDSISYITELQEEEINKPEVSPEGAKVSFKEILAGIRNNGKTEK